MAQIQIRTCVGVGTTALAAVALLVGPGSTFGLGVPSTSGTTSQVTGTPQTAVPTAQQPPQPAVTTVQQPPQARVQPVSGAPAAAPPAAATAPAPAAPAPSAPAAAPKP